MNNSVISIDLAKNVFQVCVLNEHHVAVLNKKVRRRDLLKTVTKLEPNRVVMEACYSSNYWGREFQNLGKEVGLIPPHHVKPFVVGNKNDANDALAIAEASFRPKTVFVSVKTLDQQDLQSIHRIRD
jgi:transposase